MTDRYCIGEYTELEVPRGVRPLAWPAWPCTRTSPRTACATRSTSSSWSPRAPSCAGPARRATRGCARSTTSARRRSGSTRPRRSTTASAARPRATCSRSCRRPRAWTSRARWSCWPNATGSSSSASRRIRGEAERRKRRERLLELLAARRDYYERYLWESSEAAPAREYLRGRGLGEEILREFRVGYAPSAWDRVLLASRRGGFSEQELYATGLAQRSKQNGQPYDRFRSRIMFPLADIRGRVLGFGARAMRDDQRPEVPEHLRQRRLPQGPAPLRRRPGAGASPRAPGR